ncbi:hypothetical protein PT974_08060 [Cladobotryum mycophilum]|uniref:F-box domain-containing protein n=1 Tax=Cladobotryum mycophilum TaxID=491253 RepID=A0ABR0SCC2_9HYPO
MAPLSEHDIDCNARILYEDFVVPAQIASEKDEINPTDPPILRQPMEILVKILSYVTAEASIYVAFSCKRLLKASSFIPIRRPFIKECTNRVCDYADLHDDLQYEMAYFLRPLTPPGPWKFCQGCLIFRGRDGARWEEYRYHVLRLHIVDAYRWDVMMGMWQQDYEPNCPKCQAEELRRLDEKSQRDALTRLVRMGYW